MKKLISVLLAGIMLLGTLSACAGTPAESSDTTAASDSGAVETTTAETEPEDTKIPSGLPEKMDLNGYTVTFYGKKDAGIYTEEENGDKLNDAVYARNAALKEQYNFNILQICPTNQSSPTKDIIQNVQAGDDSYQVFVDGPGSALVLYVSGNLLYDMNTLKYQDFSQPWWFEELNKSLSIAGKLHMTASSFNFTARQSLYHPMVNIDLMRDNGMNIADYYQMVRDGKWTLDEFIKMIKTGASDLNGDGVRDHKDRFGHIGEDFAGYVLAVGGGYMIASKDKDDIPYITAVGEEGVNLWEKLVNNIFSDTTNYLCIRNIKGVASIWTEQRTMMRNNQVMVQITVLDNNWRDYEINYGILPVPKATEEQENYIHTGSTYNIPVMAVPITVKNPDDVSFVLEAMAYTSYYDVLPTFYEGYLESKLARDKDSVEMLQIIHNTIVMDIGAVYGWGGYLNEIYKIVNRGTNTFASFDAANRAAATKSIEDLVKVVKSGNKG